MKKIMLAAAMAACASTASHAYELHDWHIEGTISGISTFDGYAAPSAAAVNAVGSRFSYTVRVVTDARRSPHFGGGDVLGSTLDLPALGVHGTYQYQSPFNTDYVEIFKTGSTATGFGFASYEDYLTAYQFQSPLGTLGAYFRFSNPTGSFSQWKDSDGFNSSDTLKLFDQSFNLTDLKVEVAKLASPMCFDEARWCGSLNLSVDTLVSTAVPETSAPLMSLAGLGLIGAWAARRRGHRKTA